MKTIFRTLALACSIALISSCNTTKIVDSYKDSDVNAEFEKVYVVGLTGEQVPEQKISDEIVRRFEERGIEANSTHVSFADCQCDSAEEVKKLTSKLVESDYDAILTFTKVSTDLEEDYTNIGAYDTPSGPIDYPYNEKYYSYYGYYRPLVYSSGYVTSNTVYNMEASLFNLKTGDAVWVGKTETSKPLSNEKFAEGYAKTVVDKLIYTDLVQR